MSSFNSLILQKKFKLKPIYNFEVPTKKEPKIKIKASIYNNKKKLDK